MLDFATARRNFGEWMKSTTVDAGSLADAQVGIALINARQGKFESTLASVRTVLTLDTEHLHALNVAAMASIGLSDLDAAMQYLQRVEGLTTG
jgi:hypothetical protein